MECNKDEASRAKEIAEKKFREKDIVGAKKFALKAQNLYPGLEGIFQMLSTLDIYISAENKISGEADWYGMLGVDPKADDETVRKQYRKLALMLHPDKNKSIGAEGAFKLVSEAWSSLSDKARRMLYDQKRNAKVPRHKAHAPSGCPSAPSPSSKRSQNLTKNKSTARSVKKRPSRAAPFHVVLPPLNRHSCTFWTVCHRCKMQYEYPKVYVGHNLLCPCCRELFLAVEIEPSYTNGSDSSTAWSSSLSQQKSDHQTASQKTMNPGSDDAVAQDVAQGNSNANNVFSNSNLQWFPFLRTAGASTATQAGI